MAGDWIKMRANLHGDPAVISVSRALRLDVYATVGRLHELWAWADQHTDDGTLPYSTLGDIDALVRCKNFADQLIRVGWLVDRGDQGILIPNWDRHNGKSAKKRVLTSVSQQRKRRSESENNSDNEGKMSENNSDNEGKMSDQKSDQRREEKSTTPIVPASGDGISPGLPLAAPPKTTAHPPDPASPAHPAAPAAAPPGEPPPPDPAVADALLRRARALKRMRPDTALDRATARAWETARKLGTLAATTPDEWAALEAYYAADIPPARDYRRRDLATLLNNWQGEVTRARQYGLETGFAAPQSASTQPVPPMPEVWGALRQLYPDADPETYQTWAAIAPSLQSEILEKLTQPQ